MARSRNIKPSLFKNELLGEADPLLTILFAGLWCLADREGRLEDRPRRIKAEIFPYRELPLFNGYLTELERLGFIDRYEVDGCAVIQVVSFAKHQSPHKTEKDSELPSKPLDSRVTCKAPLDNGSLPVKESLIPDSFNLIPDSLNKNKRVAKATAPVTEIVSLYHDYLPNLPKCQRLTTKRSSQINARWGESPEVQTLDWWHAFFEKVGRSEFLNGKNDRRWTANLEWITKSENFTKILEGHYDRKSGHDQTTEALMRFVNGQA